MTLSLQKGDIWTHRQGRMHREDTVWRRRRRLTSRGERPGAAPSLTVSTRQQPCQHLHFRFLACKTGRRYILVFLSSPVCVICYCGPRKLIWVVVTNSYVVLSMGQTLFKDVLCIGSFNSYTNLWSRYCFPISQLGRSRQEPRLGGSPEPAP